MNKIEKFYSLQSPSDVADLFEISLQELNYRLYRAKPKYIEFEIQKKSGGVRKISSPILEIKLLQLELNAILKEIYYPRPSTHGFVTNRSIVTNAHCHKKKRYILNIDLEDFFPSIHFGRVKGLFMTRPFNFSKKIATIIARICSTYEGLPQGAPTSPIISNMICHRLDSDLQKLAKKHQCYYTRYADDITFSTSKQFFPSSLAKTVGNNIEIGHILKEVIDKNWFQINEDKVRLQNQYQRQVVTGLTVNRFPNVNRKYINQIRAMIHDLDKLGDEEALKRHLNEFRGKHHNPDRETPQSFRVIIRGKIEFLGQVRGKNDKKYRQFLKQLGVNKYSDPPIFINYASEDRDITQKLYDALKQDFPKLWMDRENIDAGQEWWEEIVETIDKSYIFIACISKATVNSQEDKQRRIVHKEVDYALQKYQDLKIEQREKNFHIIPTLIEKDVERSVRQDLGSFSYLKYHEGDGLVKLRQRLHHLIKLHRSPK